MDLLWIINQTWRNVEFEAIFGCQVTRIRRFFVIVGCLHFFSQLSVGEDVADTFESQDNVDDVEEEIDHENIKIQVVSRCVDRNKACHS